MNRFPIAALLAAVAVVIAGGCEDDDGAPAAARARALAITNANVVTLDPSLPKAKALAVRDGRIVYVGDDPAAATEAAGDGARAIDLGGATVLPGLIDAHAHLASLGHSLGRIDLRGVDSPQKVAKLLAEAAAAAPEGAWIQGRGWDQNLWPGKAFPHRSVLDAVCPDRPVWLGRIDGHAGWANSKALEVAGVTAQTKDPEGGRIIRDENGEPTGVFVDNAEGLIARAIPDPSPAEVEQAIRRAAARCAELGLTQVHDAGVGQEEIDIMLRLAEAGELPIRVYVMLAGSDEKLIARWFEKGRVVGAGAGAGGRVTIRSVKLYADGALGSRGATLLADYSDEADNRGLAVTSAERILEVTRRAAKAGFQVGTHAIGDRANREVLDGYEEVIAEVEGDHRFRVEHAQIVALADLERFAKLGVIASMQPTHATSDMPWAEDRVGPERIKGGYAWRTIRDAGGVLAFGSDFPVEKVSPLLGIYSGLTRADHDGEPEGGWYPEQKLTALETIEGFTAGAAFAGFQEKELGRVKEGFLADLTVLDTDVSACAPAEILGAKVVMTVVGGEVVFSPK